jgi:hypothetical protein
MEVTLVMKRVTCRGLLFFGAVILVAAMAGAQEPVTVSMARSISGVGADGVIEPGAGSIEVTLRLTVTGDPSQLVALGIEERHPLDWAYVGVSGPCLPPIATESVPGLLEIAWISPPGFPCEFTYTLDLPPEPGLPAVIEGASQWRVRGQNEQVTGETAVTELRGVDTEPPDAVCRNLELRLGADGVVAVTAQAIDGGSTDNGGAEGLSFSASQTRFTCANLGANTVVLTVTDGAGNAATCIAVVNVVDTTGPAVTCRGIEAPLGADGTVTIAPGEVVVSAEDNCGVASISLSRDTFTSADLGENTVTVTARDASGNEAMCTAAVTVVFSEATSYTLTVNTSGQGIAQAAPAGPYAPNAVVSLTAQAAEGWEFVRWEGPVREPVRAGTTVVMDRDIAVTAVFAEGIPEYTLTIVTWGEGAVHVNPEQAAYPAGSAVAITAEPAEGWVFDQWQGLLEGTADPTVNLAIDADTTLEAVFVKKCKFLGFLGCGRSAQRPDRGLSDGLVVLLVTGWLVAARRRARRR